MDSKEILENNEIIAKFMKFSINTKQVMYDTRTYYDISILQLPSFIKVACLEQYDFHRSWDWLIPVVEKIESLGCIIEISFSLVTTCRICNIGKKNEKAINFINAGNNSIEVIYKTVVEYIKHYNGSIQQ